MFDTTHVLDAVRAADVMHAGIFSCDTATPVDELARLVDEEFLRRYLVSYCSPARAGKRTVEWVVKLKDEDGRTRSAQAASELDATGFNASCRPAPPQTSSL